MFGCHHDRQPQAGPPQDVLELYSEVLARLEMSYVDPLEMTQLVRGGTAYLEVALTEPKFIAAFLPNQNAQAIEQFRTNIHRLTLARPVANRFEARSIVVVQPKRPRSRLVWIRRLL